MPSTPPSSDSKPGPVKRPTWLRWLMKLCLWGGVLVLSGVVALVLFLAVALSVAYPNLPDISELSGYLPQHPLSLYSADRVVIGEFGAERP